MNLTAGSCQRNAPNVLRCVSRCSSKRFAVCWGEGTTAAQRLRCAIFLLQLLSNILKAERGASHPERSRNAPASQAASTTTTGGSTKKAGSTNTTSDHNGCAWEREAAQACARASSAYLGSLVKAAAAAAALKARGQSGGGGDDHHRSEHATAVAALDGEDAGFWVLAFLSDVLKCLRKDRWRCGDDPTLATGCKRTRDGEAREVKGVSRSPPSAAVAAGKAGVSSDDGRGSGPSGLAVDVSGLARLVAAFPVGCGKRAMDVALKWLEVTMASGFAGTKERWMHVPTTALWFVFTNFVVVCVRVLVLCCWSSFRRSEKNISRQICNR